MTSLDVGQWSSCLGIPEAYQLVERHKKLKTYFSRCENQTSENNNNDDPLLWLMAMIQMFCPSATPTEASVAGRKVLLQMSQMSQMNLDHGPVACEQIQDVVLQHLQRTAVLLNRSERPLGDYLWVAQTEPVIIDSREIQPWEMDFVSSVSELDCSSSAVTSLEGYRPVHSWKDTPFVLTWSLTPEDDCHHFAMRGRIYVRWNHDDRFGGRKSCQSLHRVLSELKVTSLPEFPKFLDVHTFERGENDHNASPQTSPLAFPLSCSYEYFRTRAYHKSLVTTFGAMHRKMECLASLSPKTGLDEFVALHERTWVTDWFCRQLQQGRKIGESGPTKTTTTVPVISFYSTSLQQVDTAYRVKGGLLYGDALVGKTFYMLRHVLLQVEQEQERGLTLYVVQPYDKKVVLSALAQAPETCCSRVDVYWERKDFVNVTPRENGRQSRVVIVNAKFLSRASELKSFLSASSIKRLVVDHYEKIDYHTRLYKFLDQLRPEIVWLLTSKLTLDMVPWTYKWLRLDRSFPGSRLGVDFNLVSCALFASVSYRVEYGVNQMTENTQYTCTPYRVGLRRSADQWPYQQIVVALRETLRRGTPKRHAGLLALLARLDSGVPIRKEKVRELLMFHSFNLRVGGGLYRVLPPLEQLPVHSVSDCLEPEDLCGICRDDMEDPVKNEVCCHMFCFKCIEEWNKMSSSCPLCRVDYGEAFFKVEFTGRESFSPSCLPAKKRRRLCDVYSSESKELKTRESKNSEEADRDMERQAVPVEELYLDPHRERSLKNFLTSTSYNKVLIITHWRGMVKRYGAMAEEALGSGSTIGTISEKLNYTDLHRAEVVVERSDVVVTYGYNVNYFRNDGRFKQVIIMDSDGCTTMVENWYNYFRHCLSRVYHFSFHSIDKMYMKMLDEMAAGPNRTGNNVRFPKMTPKTILGKYYAFLTE